MKRIILVSVWLAAWLTAPGASAAGAADPVSDVRVLIDVSGSMKHNDPHNLRASAMRLIVGLLPPGARAGVWTFAQYTNMLVPEATVDRRWRGAARQASRQITSNGLYTDIEAALKAATWDWRRPDPASRRSIILLTDGLVDIASGKPASVASRRHILDDITERLHRAGVTVYTLGLSDGADQPLLQQMAAGTGGWYDKVADADGLEKAFLHMFEKSTHRDSLPLRGNAVTVDGHVQELTLLVFRKDGAQATRLVTPSRRTLTQADAPASVRWHHETRYDLITIEHPETGQWRVLADEDPDNRVMVVTNLKMRTTALPNHVLAGHRVPVAVHFTQAGTTITQPAFLKFVQVKLTQSDEHGASTTVVMHDDGAVPDEHAGDGVYTAVLGDDLAPGHHEVRVLADGVTFQRQSQQLLSVETSPVITTVRPDDARAPAAYVLSVIPRAGLIDADTMTVQATITDPNGEQTTVDVPHAYADEWRYAIATDGRHGRYRVTISVSARDADGTPVHFNADPMAFGRAVAVPARTAPAPAAAASPVHAKAAAAAPPPAGPDWSTAAALLFAVNLLVAGAAYGAWLWMRRSTALALRPLEEELL